MGGQLKGGPKVIRVSVFYFRKPGSQVDYQYYVNDHLPLAIERLKDHGLLRLEVDTGIAGEPYPLFTASHFTFRSLREYQEGLGSQMEELTTDIPVFSNTEPEVVVSQIERIEYPNDLTKVESGFLWSPSSI